MKVSTMLDNISTLGQVLHPLIESVGLCMVIDVTADRVHGELLSITHIRCRYALVATAYHRMLPKPVGANAYFFELNAPFSFLGRLRLDTNDCNHPCGYGKESLE